MHALCWHLISQYSAWLWLQTDFGEYFDYNDVAMVLFFYCCLWRWRWWWWQSTWRTRDKNLIHKSMCPVCNTLNSIPINTNTWWWIPSQINGFYHWTLISFFRVYLEFMFALCSVKGSHICAKNSAYEIFIFGQYKRGELLMAFNKLLISQLHARIKQEARTNERERDERWILS